jgi:hypothetical protein
VLKNIVVDLFLVVGEIVIVELGFVPLDRKDVVSEIRVITTALIIRDILYKITQLNTDILIIKYTRPFQIIIMKDLFD